jgi:polar amino acid transport system substrate-binding protein
VQALRDKRIALFVHDDPVLRAYATGADDLVLLQPPLTNEELAWAVRRDDPDLLDEVNSALASWKRDGTLEGLIKKWLPQ